MWKNTDYPARLAEVRRMTEDIAMAAIRGRQRAGASEKLRAIVEQPPQTFRIPPFLGQSEIPPGVLRSVLSRKVAIWGRF